MTQPALFHESGIICPHCGTSSVNDYVAIINHSLMPREGLCTYQALLLRAARFGDPERTQRALDAGLTNARIEQEKEHTK